MMEVKKGDTLILRGIGIGSGCVGGKVKFFCRGERRIASGSAPSDPAREVRRMEEAIEKTQEDLFHLQRTAQETVGEEEAAIFEIHRLILEDEDFIDTLHGELASGKVAEDAVEGAVEKYTAMLLALNDAYLSARSADIKDIAAQLLRHLSGVREPERGNEEDSYLLIADDLAPSETVLLDKSKILGFITFAGTPNSHTSILARAMGIPALIGVGEIERIYDGCCALLDASDGTLILSPNDAQRTAFEEKQRKETALTKEHERYLRTLIGQPTVTRGGHRMLIYANIGEVSEVSAALFNGAEGIGLLRSELLYLSSHDYPTEEALFQNYYQVVSAMRGKKIIIRTLDIGADKQIEYFDLPREENPALGFRGIRICLARKEIFKTQLRAILRASAYGSVSVMLPMVVSPEEVRTARAVLEECKKELERENQRFDENLKFGIMIETPAAAIMSEELAKEVDFFSVGTNDLAQYTLAADRQNAAVEPLCRANREPVLRLIEYAAQSIHKSGGWIGICGELAADLHLTQRFADMGIDELSVSVPYLLGVREKVTECK